MFKKNDPNTFSKYCKLMNGTDESTDVIGTIFSEYQVSNYDDVQLKSFDAVSKSKVRKFLVQTFNVNNIRLDAWYILLRITNKRCKYSF
jgi:hypothetical protein